MAVRREQVILDLDDKLTPGLARAAVAASVLDRELKRLGGSSSGTGRDLDRTATATDKVGASARRASPEVDRMSGRMRIWADVAATLGPVLVPLGAAAIPALTAALAGLGAAAGGIGVTVLAMHGLGDAIKALDTYKLAPTAENLQKLRIEQEKLGPAGAEFARYITNLEPTLRNLQNTARAGLFPGLEDGIDAILARGPEVTQIISELATGMGDVARSAGMALAGDEWTPFFDYVEQTAKPTLESFATATGNVALGLANLIVAFAPVQQDFTDGLVSMTESFARWSQGLDENQGFQDFVSYIQESGPQVIDFLGALVKAMAGIVQAAAPWGTVVLQALTGVAKVFGAIADSPIGPGLYTAAAAMIAFTRASSIAEKSSARFTATWDKMSRLQTVSGGIGGLALLASSLTDVDEKAGLANTTLGASAGLMVGGPWGLAIGAAIGQVLDFKDAYDQANASISAADDALRNGDTNDLLKERAALMAELSKEHPDNVTLSNYFDAVRGSFHNLTGQTDDFKRSIDEINEALQGGNGDLANLFGETIGKTGDELKQAADDARNFSGALAELNGWFDKRDAVRGYKDAIDELRKSMKDGFTREDAANLDNIGKSILQVATNIKSPRVRNNFLEGAREQLADMAEHSGPKAAAAIQEIIDKFDEKGFTNPPPIEPTVDDSRASHASERLKNKVKGDFDIMDALSASPTVDADSKPAEAKIGTVRQFLNILDRAVAKPAVDVDPGNSLSILDLIKARLGSLHDRTINVRVNQSGGVTSSAGGHSTDAPGGADGMTVPGPRFPYGDKLTIRVAPGEEIITNRHGEADRFRADRASGRIPGYANGGTAGSTYTSMLGNSGDKATDGVHIFTAGVYSAAKALKALNAELKAQQKAYDKAKAARDAAVSRRDSLSSTIQQNLMGGSIFAASTGSAWAAGQFGANTPQGAIAALNARTDRAHRFVAALNTLKGKGVTGAALQEIISEGLEATEAMAAADVGTLSTFAGAVNQSSAELAAAGLAGGNAVEGENVRRAGKQLDRLHDDLRDVQQAINHLNQENTKAQDKNAKDVKAGINSTASGGHRRGK